jgi:hypothetical protein
MSAYGCDFNRSTQHLISDYREEDVVDEVQTENLLHRTPWASIIGRRPWLLALPIYNLSYPHPTASKFCK